MTIWFRPCPTCGAENAPEVLRCPCGALLAGIDLQLRETVSPTTPAATDPTPATPAFRRCPFDDCGADNPADAVSCLYCNRPLAPPATAAASQTTGLLHLPASLASRYRIVQPFPASGAEAELLLVEPVGGGTPLVAKIYRRGVFPKTAVLERVQHVDRRYRVELIETGHADGHAYEVMEYCAAGSLRQLARDGALDGGRLRAVIGELAPALAALHGEDLVHRDLKPDNILIRCESPLQLILTDFGIASVMEATQRFTGAARTLHYAAPESLSGIIDAKTDYWALGILLLELAQGRHPFSGLSDPVILHYLSTRSMDVSGIEDPALRQLLRGLLLRDPARRWGNAEITRWLAKDPSLPDPHDAGSTGFSSPYRLCGEVCLNAGHLAIALARHWQAGVSDLDNGQLLAWFRDVQKDQDTVRLLLELRYERAVHLDVQLLRLILHLAPGIPPVWRGERIDLASILARANAAMKGQREATAWLDALYQHRVLEAYAEAGNTTIEGIARRWNAACDAFDAAWSAQMALLEARKQPAADHEIVHFDDIVFGRHLPERPTRASLHARLLAFAFDPAWERRFRAFIGNEVLALKVDCPWLAELGEPATMSATALFALESLLPEARKEAERVRQARERHAESARREVDACAAEARAIVETLSEQAHNPNLDRPRCAQLAELLSAYASVYARLRASGAAPAEVMTPMRRLEPLAHQLRRKLDDLDERRTITRGWFNPAALGLIALMLLILPPIFGNWLFFIILGGAGGILAWRKIPEHDLKQQIRRLLAQIAEPRRNPDSARPTTVRSADHS